MANETIEIYGFMDANDCEHPTVIHEHSEAKEFAVKNKLKMVALKYEFVDSDELYDFTPCEDDSAEDLCPELEDEPCSPNEDEFCEYCGENTA
jgi:hypothetical protein